MSIRNKRIQSAASARLTRKPPSRSMNLKLILPDGATYCTNAAGERVCNGSSMGRSNHVSDDYQGEPLRLHRIPPASRDRFEDYDEGGAYWGTVRGMWVAWRGEHPEGTEYVRVYVRALDRRGAIRLVGRVFWETYYPKQPSFYRTFPGYARYQGDPPFYPMENQSGGSHRKTI